MDGFQVTMSDLEEAASSFSTRAAAFAGSMRAGGPVSADGGSWVINDALSLVLAAVRLLHEQMTASISADGRDL